METPSSAADVRSSLGLRTVQGAAWTLGTAVAGKAVALLSQVALAWFLVPGDLGLVAMTFSLAGAVSVVAGTNLSTLLIQRRDGEDFNKMAGQVFWLALAMNTAGALLLLGLAPFAGTIFGDARVKPLIWVMALASPLMALPTIYSASLYRQLRFRATARIVFVVGLVQNAVSVALAANGWGPYSLLVPLVLGSVVSAVLNRWAAGKIPIGLPDPHQWIPLLSASIWLLLNSLFLAIRNHGMNFAVGAVGRDSTVTGLYFWGYTVAFQAVFLLATNLQGVFFPSLTQLNAEPDRQFAAFRKAAGMLGLCAVVVSVLQITTAEPLIPLIFGEKWTRAVPVVQWLSVAIITQPLNVLATSVLLAWGQFRAVAMVTALTGALLTVAAVAGAGSGNERQIAAWTAGAILIGNLAPGWMVYRRCGQGLRRLAGDLLPLLLVGVPGLVLARAEILSRWGPVVHVVSVCCLVGLTSVGAARWITPELFREMVARSKELIGAACKPRS